MLTITKTIDFSKTVDITITTEDIAHCLITSPVIESLDAALKLCNDCATILNGIPDSIISEMNDAQRKTITDFLKQSAARINKRPPPAEKIQEKVKTGKVCPACLGDGIDSKWRHGSVDDCPECGGTGSV